MKHLIAVLSLFAAFGAYGQTALVYTPDSNNSHIPGIRIQPVYVDARVLAAGVAETHTVPATATWVFFSTDCATVFIRPGASVAVPAADVTDGTSGERNPTAWKMFGMTQISLVSPTACVVTLSFYR